jgi:hypothetical protein
MVLTYTPVGVASVTSQRRRKPQHRTAAVEDGSALIRRVGPSSLRIVPTPRPSKTVAPIALFKLRKKDSLGSGVVPFSYGAFCLWILGYPKQVAQQREQTTLAQDGNYARV